MDDLVEAIDKLLERNRVYSNQEVKAVLLELRNKDIKIRHDNPSAFTYNRINKGMSRLLPLFIYEGTSRYRYIGWNFPFNGKLVHNPKGGSPIDVGQWTNGRLSWLDPDVRDFDSWKKSVQ